MVGEHKWLMLTKDIDIEERYQSIPNATVPIHHAYSTTCNFPYMEEPTRSYTDS